MRGIAFTHFTSEDVVRHPLVERIVNAYEAQTERAEQARRNDRRDGRPAR